MVETRSPEETRGLARRLGERLRPGDVVALNGELGAGKTQFVKGLALGVGLADERLVTSPTFVLMNRYDGRIPLHHYDLYRLASPDLESLGFFDHLREGAAAVEWADKAGDALGDRLETALESTGETTRRITLRALGARSEKLLELLAGVEPSGPGQRS